jgi:competence protein ComEC
MTERPLVGVAVAFMLGILAAACAVPPPAFVLPLLAAAVGLLLTRRPFWFLCLVLLGFATLGYWRCRIASIVPAEDVSHLAPVIITVTGVVQSDVDLDFDASGTQARRAKFVLTVDQAEGFDAAGNVEVTVPLASALQDTSVAQKSADLPRYGDRGRVHGRLEVSSGPRNPGAFDYRAWLAQRGIFATLTARRAADWQILQPRETRGNPLKRLAFALRRSILGQARKALPPTEAGVLNGILLGERGDLPASLRDDFERTGTTHILATAGLHVGLVTWLLLAFLHRLRVPHRSRLILTLGILWLYAVMAGERPSVVRAVVMASVYLVGILLEREPDLLNTMGLAALILLAMSPYNLFDAGFQLSFATVLTIILLMPFAEAALRSLRRRARGDRPGRELARRLLTPVAVCFFLALASWIGSLPLVACYFHNLSLVSVFANTLIVPAIPAVIALGFIAALFGPLLPWLAGKLYAALHALLAFVIAVVQWCSSLQFAGINVVSPPWPLIAAYYLAVWGAAWRLQSRIPPHRFYAEPSAQNSQG